MIAKSVQWVLVVPSMKQIMTGTLLTVADYTGALLLHCYCIIAQVKDVGGYG